MSFGTTKGHVSNSSAPTVRQIEYAEAMLEILPYEAQEEYDECTTKEEVSEWIESWEDSYRSERPYP